MYREKKKILTIRTTSRLIFKNFLVNVEGRKKKVEEKFLYMKLTSTKIPNCYLIKATKTVIGAYGLKRQFFLKLFLSFFIVLKYYYFLLACNSLFSYGFAKLIQSLEKKKKKQESVQKLLRVGRRRRLENTKCTLEPIYTAKKCSSTSIETLTCIEIES